MEETKLNLKKQARISGLLYLLMALGAFGIVYVPSELLVVNDPAATASNILENEFLLRMGIFSNLFCQTVFIFLALSLYKLFESVDKNLSRTLLAIVLVAVPIAYFIAFDHYYALSAMNKSYMAAFEGIQQDAIANAFLINYNDGIAIIGIFWGLWLIPFGQLSIKSGFIPKILGYLLIIGGSSYLLDACAFILFPEFHPTTSILAGIFSGIAEISMILWLLFKGVKSKST